MIKVSKKIISVVSGTSALIIAGSTILANLAIKNNNSTSSQNDFFSKNYHYFSIINKMSTNEKLKMLIDYTQLNKNIIYFINEKKFISNFKAIVQETLKNIPNFSLNYLDYEIKCNYKIINPKMISINLVWWEKGSKIKFFDQFNLYLQIT